MDVNQAERFLDSITQNVPLRFVVRATGQTLLLGAKEVTSARLTELAGEWLASERVERTGDDARTLSRAAYTRVWQTAGRCWPETH